MFAVLSKTSKRSLWFNAGSFLFGVFTAIFMTFLIFVFGIFLVLAAWGLSDLELVLRRYL